MPFTIKTIMSRVAFLKAVRLSVFILSVVMLGVIMLSAPAPQQSTSERGDSNKCPVFKK